MLKFMTLYVKTYTLFKGIAEPWLFKLEMALFWQQMPASIQLKIQYF